MSSVRSNVLNDTSASISGSLEFLLQLLDRKRSTITYFWLNLLIWLHSHFLRFLLIRSFLFFETTARLQVFPSSLLCFFAHGCSRPHIYKRSTIITMDLASVEPCVCERCSLRRISTAIVCIRGGNRSSCCQLVGNRSCK